MRGRSIVSRVVRGTVLVALLSSLTLAATAASVSWFVWAKAEQRALARIAPALAQAIEGGAVEDRTSVEQAVPEAIRESALVGYRIEVWRGRQLVAMSPVGRPIGPVPSETNTSFPPAGWICRTEALPEGLTLVIGLPEEFGRRALGVFVLSLLLSAPMCLLLALLVGRIVGRRATRPLADFTESVSRIREIHALDRPTGARMADAPLEVRDLELSFRELLARLGATLSRELEFAANASHELRTPLTSIRLRAERLRTTAAPDARDDLDELLRETDRLVRLVDSLLVLARDVQAGIPMGETVNLADIMRDALARTFAGHPAPIVDLPDEAPVLGDGNLLGIAVENILDNARKFTPRPAGCIVRLGADGGLVRLEVVSPGVSVPDAMRERLFERFYRGPEARTAHEGYGIGLPLARHIALLHGGNLVCLPSASEEVRFVLELPGWKPETDRVSSRS